MTIAPILVLLLSALITWFIRNRHNRTQWVVSSSLGFIVWALMLLIDVEASDPLGLSVWQPADLFQSPISLTIDSSTWPLIYGAVTVLLAVILTAATRPSAERAGVRSFWFFYTALALTAIMSANLLTVMMAWAMMDFGTLFFLLAISERESSRREIFIRAAINAISVLLVISAAMVSDIQGIVSLDLTSTSSLGILMLALAASFRLGLIPLHFTLPPIDPLRRGVGTLLRLFPPVVAMALLARVFSAGLPTGLRNLFLVAGSLGALLGGVRWVLQIETVRARPFFVLALSSLGVIVAAIAPKGSHVIVATGLLLLLAGAVLSLFANHTPSHRIIPVLTSVLLLGAPFTPGGVYAAVVVAPGVIFKYPVIALVAITSVALLALGCFHLFFTRETPWPIGESLARVLFNVGLVLPVLASIGVGVWRLRADPLFSAIFFGSALAISSASFLGFRSLSIERVDQLRRMFQRFDPDRLYARIWKIFQRVLIGVRGVGELFEGVSGMLWLFVFVIILLFIVR